MVIQSSQVGMHSTYSKTSISAQSMMVATKGGLDLEALKQGRDIEELNALSVKGSIQTKTESHLESNATNGSSPLAKKLQRSAEESIENWSEKALSEEKKVEFFSLKNLFEVLGDPVEARPTSPESIFQKLLAQFRERFESFFSGMGNSLRRMDSKMTYNPISPYEKNSLLWGKTREKELLAKEFELGGVNLLDSVYWIEEATIENFQSEQEKLSFQSAGEVVTSDGRSITFDTSFSMTQSFVSYTNVNIDYKRVMMIDPLVINLSENVTTVRDQTFLFDIDADGEKDNISLLGQMCGFLALDRNGDGIINDGSELFGAKTGDGFAELAVFDLDGNGWIDENDEIFNRLRVWTKDENGNDKLVALGVSGIGAIYLGNVSTELMLSADNHSVDGMVRKSGIFLKEDGSVGTIQHVDLAKKEA